LVLVFESFAAEKGKGGIRVNGGTVRDDAKLTL
jgi:hypothetical protein